MKLKPFIASLSFYSLRFQAIIPFVNSLATQFNNTSNISNNISSFSQEPVKNKSNLTTQLQQKMNIGIDSRKGMLLIDSIKENKPYISKALLKCPHVDLNIQNNDGFTALMYAINRKQFDIIEIIFQNKDFDPNIQDKFGLSPLMGLIWIKNLNLTQLIVQNNKTNVNLMTTNRETAFSFALKMRNIDLVKILIKHKDIDLNIKNSNDVTPLMNAVISNEPEFVALILQNKKVNVNFQNDHKMTSLMISAQDGRMEIVKELLKRKDLYLNLQSSNGNTAIMEAIQNNHDEIALLLLDQPHINTNLKSSYGMALHYAVLYNKTKLVAKILEKENTNVNCLNQNNMTPLMICAKTGRTDILNELLKRKDIDLTLKNNFGNTALLEAIFNDHKNIYIRLLEQTNIEINIKNDMGDIPLIKIIQKNNDDFTKKFILHKDIGINIQDNSGNTPLMHCLLNQKRELAKLLLQKTNQLDINIQNKDKKTALMYAIELRENEITKMIIQYDNVNMNIAENYNITALMHSIFLNETDIVSLILKHKSVNINQKDFNHESALMYAIKHKHTKIALNILKHPNITINSQNKNNETPLFLAIKTKQTEIAKQILNNKTVNVNLQTNGGNTPLMIAIENNETDIAIQLLNNPNTNVTLKNEGGSVAFIGAMLSNETLIIKKIMHHPTFNINEQTNDGSTLLMSTLINNRIDIATEMLQNKKIKINLQLKNGNTMLMYAIMKNQANFVQHILSVKHVNVNIQNQYGLTAFNYALNGNNLEIITQLLNHKDIDLNKKDKAGDTTLIIAIKQGKINIAKQILRQESVNVNIKNKDGLTALMIARNMYYIGLIDYILDHSSFDYKAHKAFINEDIRSLVFTMISVFIIYKVIQWYSIDLFNSIMKSLSKTEKSKKSWELASKLRTTTSPIKKIKLAQGYSKDILEENKVNKIVNTLNLNETKSIISDIETEQRFFEYQPKNSDLQIILNNRKALLSKPILQTELENYQWPIKNKWLKQTIYDVNINNINLKTFKSKIDSIEREFNELKENYKQLLSEKSFDYRKLKACEKLKSRLCDILSSATTSISKWDDAYNKFTTVEFISYLNSCIKTIDSTYLQELDLQLSKKTWDIFFNYFNEQSDINKKNIGSFRSQVKGKEISELIKHFNEQKNNFISLYKKINFDSLYYSYIDYDKLVSQVDEIKKQEFNNKLFDTVLIECNNFTCNHIHNLTKIKDLDKLAFDILNNDNFLHICDHLNNKLNPIDDDVSEVSSDEDSQQVDDDVLEVSSDEDPQQVDEYVAPIHLFLEHIKIDLGIHLTSEVTAAKSQSSATSVSTISTTLKIKPSERADKLKDLVADFSKSFNQKMGDDSDISKTIEERNKTLGHIILLLLKGKPPEQLERIRTNMIKKRKKEHLQTQSVIHNSVAHTNSQEKLSKNDIEKITHEFKTGMLRLNGVFNNFHLSEINLSEDKMDQLINLYVIEARKLKSNSAHYRLLGPFIIPSAKQHLDRQLVFDRWVALRIFEKHV